ncbi:hypothetical protein ASG91_04715 [Phycicoccus sp. Soil802]|nr:hypothetical protein ASG91_04715 [Phycicoccus sp. Soil802]
MDLVRTNAVLGREIAKALTVDWDPALHTERNKVTLEGLNVLLAGATEARQRGSLRRLRDAAPAELAGPAWAAFQPARSKIEAVTRIAALTRAPKEWLGPGAKEHKSVLTNLADRALPDVAMNRSSKTKLAASLATEFGVPWTDKCESTGETISLTGLNMILAGAERHLGFLGSEVVDALAAPEDEGDALAAALLAKLPSRWDGKLAVKWLADRGLRGANDNEWQGFYGEERAKVVLAGAFTPPDRPRRVRYGNTAFDYALNFVWDIKVHTETQVFGDRVAGGKTDTLLNDERAIRACIDEQGLGFLIVNGAAEMDESGEFVAWHRQFKAGRGGPPAAPSNSGTSRTRKAAFTTLHVESFWVPNSEALDAAILRGALKVKPIGRQAPRALGGEGAARADKFVMRMREARKSIRVARYDW